jgi:hypothetical protein
MRFISTTLYAVAAITLTTSCSADRSLPDASAPAIASGAASSGRPVLSAEKRRGLYVSTNSSSTMWGYPNQNSQNKPPICTVPWNVAVPYDIAVDGKGNLIEPDDNSKTINIGAGPGMCGPKIATISDPYGYPIDAASNDATTGVIAVATIGVGTLFTPSGIAVCSIAKGCYAWLSRQYLFSVTGVAMDRRGDCWLSVNYDYATKLLYFKNCAGSGEFATNYANFSPDGLDIDTSGNIVAVDDRGDYGLLWVYSGCKPTCTIVSESALRSWGHYGKLNRDGNKFAFADEGGGVVDIYGYAPTGVKYEYSFDNGLPSAPEGIAYNPRSKE